MGAARSTPHDEAARHLDAACAGRALPLVLEAGCGVRSQVALPSTARVIGVDRARSQLRRHTGAAFLIEGDITALPVGSAAFDAVVSWDVLEHVADPRRALAELRRVVRPGGVIVLGLPHVLSLKGLVTRATPWWVHVWVYRRILGDPTAGTEASDQFPTTMRLVLRPAGLRRLARELRLQVVMLAAYPGPVPTHFRRRHRAGDLLLGAIGGASRLLSFGRYDANDSDLVVVLRAVDADAASAGEVHR